MTNGFQIYLYIIWCWYVVPPKCWCLIVFFWLFRWFWKKQYRLQAMNWNFQLGSNKKTMSSSRGKSDSRESPDYLGFQLGHCCWRICCFLTLILTSVSFLLIRDAVLLSRIDGRTPGASEDWLVKCSKKRCGGHMPNIDVMVLKHPLPLSSCFWKRIPTQLNSSIQPCIQNHLRSPPPPQFYPHSTTISTAHVLFSGEFHPNFSMGNGWKNSHFYRWSFPRIYLLEDVRPWSKLLAGTGDSEMGKESCREKRIPTEKLRLN